VVAVRKDYAAPTELEILMIPYSTNMPRLTALWAGATPKTATGTGALPSNVPVGGRAPAPANGSLGWTNGAKGVARENPKGISSSSPALPDAIGLRRVMIPK
jgi:hypothetical protein